MPNIFLNNWWPGVLLWSVLYILDYTMTILNAKLYRQGVNEKIVFEGSYELTPIFQKDIDQLRTVSPRFVGLLILYGFLIAGVWFLASLSDPQFYVFLLGAFIGIQLAVHGRHFNNFVLFGYILANESVKGRIEYSRPMLLRTSAWGLFTWGVVFAVLAGLTLSWFLAGAATSCLATASKHFQLARKNAAPLTGATQVANAG